MRKINPLLLWLLMSMIGIVLASDSAPATLPKGFLEQLPTLEAFKNDEFEAFISFVGKELNSEQANKNNNHSNNDNQEIFDVNE